jgi:(2Fe-2S) ferredoxin
MEKPARHIFVCGSFRASGEPQGICNKKGSVGLLNYLEGELTDRGMTDVFVSLTTCLKVCDRGPAMVIYPDNIWYGGVESEDAIDEILDALEDGELAEAYVMN